MRLPGGIGEVFQEEVTLELSVDNEQTCEGWSEERGEQRVHFPVAATLREACQ